jgi:PAS domain S-box-containing protein
MINETAVTKSLLELVFSFMPGNIYWVDQEGKILGANDQEARTLGFKTRQEAIGKNIREICPPEIAEDIIRKNLLVLEKDIPMTFEEPWVHADGTEKFYLSHKIPFWVEGQLIGILGISTDITDQKLREKLEAEQEVLKKANEMMRFWAGAIAHEIRTPLMSIAMMADTLDFFLSNLKQDYPELWKDSPRKAASLEYIQKLPKNFAEITKGMNHFVDMALMKVSPERARVYELKPMQIKDSVKMVLDAYPFKMLDEDKNERDLVHVNILDNFTFNGDETLFRHLIYNLMKNAIFFIRKAGKGEVFIDAIAAKKTDKDPHPVNLLILKDTGPGIPAEHLQHLFKAFFSRSQNGTGVGLSLCKTIMNEFGGRIYCESVEGEFTKFVMEFPRN